MWSSTKPGAPDAPPPTEQGGPDGATPAATPGSAFTKPAPDGHAKKLSEVLGEVAWLMSQSPLHKQLFISDLEWLVMTPVLLQQFRLFYDDNKPIGVAFWATASDEVAGMLAAGTTNASRDPGEARSATPVRMRPHDWKSGEQLWIVEVIAPFGGAELMVQDLKQNVFPTREMRFLAMSAAAGKEVRRV
jgi:cytolysin-activating lysine-acyltransferase